MQNQNTKQTNSDHGDAPSKNKCLYLECIKQQWINVYIFRVNYLNYRTPLCVVIFVLRRFKTDENSNKHNSSTSTKQSTNVLSLRDFQILQPNSHIKKKPLPQHPENKAILNPHPPNERAQPVSEQPCGSDRQIAQGGGVPA